MAGGLNKVMIIGNLGRDPELRSLPSGKPATTFSVAVSRRWTDGGGQPREETEWFAVVVYEKLAEVANQYLTKGQKVYVEGRLQTRAWEGQDGQQHTRTEIVAGELVFLSGARRTGDPEARAVPAATDDDLPF